LSPRDRHGHAPPDSLTAPLARKLGNRRTRAATRADDGTGPAALRRRPSNTDWTLSKGVAMKATLTALAALLVTTIPLNPASAQSPYQYPVMPAGYGNPGYAPGPAASAPTGGCDSCGAKPSLLSKLGFKSGGCANGGCGAGGLCSKCKGWLCKPFPSNAPVLRKQEYPLGFPNSPYVRSPRDYFMANDP
jgi:hypothetical protein